MTTLGPGSSLGAYRIVRQLGEGGMGVVFEAVHEAIERRVAIKILHPEYARRPEFIARFFNEARAVNRVDHPGLVQISDYGQQADGSAYIVMEFLKGESLAQRLSRQGSSLPPAEVIHLGWQLADSLAAAHDKGIIHRDLKPDNVMLVQDPHIPRGERTKLLDFGIAKLKEPASAQNPKTNTNQVMGTPAYMSPEQCAGAGGVDEKSDVYSLGIMLFEMLSGTKPFVAEGFGQILSMHMFMEPPRLRERAPGVPANLAELVQKLLTKNKANRPTMRQLALQLAAMSASAGPPSGPGNHSSRVAEKPRQSEVDPEATRRLAGSTLGYAASQPAIPRKQRLPLRWAGMGAAALLLVGGVTVGVLQWRVPTSHREGSDAPVDKVTPQSPLPVPGPPPRAAVQPPPVSAPTPETSTITLHVESEPSGASVIRASDGKVLGQTPLQYTHPREPQGTLDLILRRKGHSEVSLSLLLGQDAHRKEILPLSSSPAPERPADRSPSEGKRPPGGPRVTPPATTPLQPKRPTHPSPPSYNRPPLED